MSNKIMKRGRIVLVLQGRHAGCKATVIKPSRPSMAQKFSHCIVAGIEKHPRRITKKMSLAKCKKRTKFTVFVKTMNQKHLMPTRYSLRLKLGDVSSKTMDAKVGQRPKLKSQVRDKLTNFYKFNNSSSARWFFRKLRI